MRMMKACRGARRVNEGAPADEANFRESCYLYFSCTPHNGPGALHLYVAPVSPATTAR